MLESLKRQYRQKTSLAYLAIVRIFVGYHFIRVAWAKLSGTFLNGEGLPRMLADVTGDPFLWHQDFLSGVVIPHAVFFGYLVAFGEMAIGISLVTGCLVRVSSLFGAFHMINIYLAIGIPRGGATLGLNRTFIVCLVVFALAGAGRALGVDAILKRKFFRSWLF
jgi:thiosulfate dehydrogenase [quinone] large subunit